MSHGGSARGDGDRGNSEKSQPGDKMQKLKKCQKRKNLYAGEGPETETARYI